MENICRGESDADLYPISVNIDVDKYTNGSIGKENRCKAIDEAMDAMSAVFKRAALNSSEPLDFSVIHFYPNASNKAASYNLTDLINTSWIKSETIIEHVRKITGSGKDYVAHISDRRQDPSTIKTFGQRFMEFIDRLLEPILGQQRRLYWESTNRYEQIYSGLSNQLAHLRSGIGHQYKSLVKVFSASSVSNSTNSSLNTTNNLNKTMSSQ